MMQEVDISSKPKVWTLKKPQGRTDFLHTIVRKVTDAIKRSCLTEDRIFEKFECYDGIIEISMSNTGECEVDVCHHCNERNSPTLASTIKSMLPDWGDIENDADMEEREEQRFQDYLFGNCRY